MSQEQSNTEVIVLLQKILQQLQLLNAQSSNDNNNVMLGPVMDRPDGHINYNNLFVGTPSGPIWYFLQSKHDEEPKKINAPFESITGLFSGVSLDLPLPGDTSASKFPRKAKIYFHFRSNRPNCDISEWTQCDRSKWIPWNVSIRTGITDPKSNSSSSTFARLMLFYLGSLRKQKGNDFIFNTPMKITVTPGKRGVFVNIALFVEGKWTLISNSKDPESGLVKLDWQAFKSYEGEDTFWLERAQGLEQLSKSI